MKFSEKAAMALIGFLTAAVSAINRMLQKPIAGITYKVLSALMFAVIAVGLFPAASEFSFTDVSNTYDTGDAGFDPSRPAISVIYRNVDGSEWAKEAAKRLASQLDDRYGYEVLLIPSESAEADSEHAEGGDAVVIGHTELSERDYIQAYYSVGVNDSELYFNSRGDLIIEAFSFEGACAGIDRFLSNYNGDAFDIEGGIQFSLSLPKVSTRKADAESTREMVVIENSSGINVGASDDVNVIVFSCPDNNEYTVKAIEAIVNAEKPSFVIFCGDLSAGADSRAELKRAWDAISAPLAESGIDWCFLQSGDGSEQIPSTMINEVLPLCDGCVYASDDAMTLIVAYDAFEVPCGGFMLVNEKKYQSSPEAISADISESLELLNRAAERTVPCAVVFSGELENISADQKGNGILADAVGLGVSCFVGVGDTVDVEVNESNELVTAYAGSIGFESQGLGGRFEYNHSLRGGILLTLPCGEGNTADSNPNGSSNGFSAKYVYASDFGVTKRQ